MEIAEDGIFYMSFEDFLYEFKCTYICRLFDKQQWRKLDKIEVFYLKLKDKNYFNERVNGEENQQLDFLLRNLIQTVRLERILNMG